VKKWKSPKYALFVQEMIHPVIFVEDLFFKGE